MKTDLQLQGDVAGELQAESAIDAAEHAALRVAGVKAVANEIEVRLVRDGELTDTDIAKAVLNALKCNTRVPRERIKVKVEQGWVTLEGTVLWQFQRQAAEDVVRNTKEVQALTNLVTVNPVPTLFFPSL